MANRKSSVRITPRKDGWAVIREGSKRASSVYDTKREAEKAGREAARRDKTELYVYNRQGQIRQRDSYGSDPHPPKS